MATGANMQPGRGREVSNITPTLDLDTGEASLWQAVGRAADTAYDAMKPGMVDRAERLGQAEGVNAAAKGTPLPNGLTFGEVATARRRATEKAYLARQSAVIDAKADELETTHGFNVEGFEKAMMAAGDGIIEGSEPLFAVEVEQAFNARFNASRARVAENASRVAMQEADASLIQRSDDLKLRLLGRLSDAGDLQSEDYLTGSAELRGILDERVNNPAIPYSQTQADADMSDFTRRAMGAVAARDALSVLETEGPVAALARVESLGEQDGVPAENRMVVQAIARERVSAAISLRNQRRAEEEAEKGRRARALSEAIEDDLGSVQVTGDGAGLNEARIRELGGNTGDVARWLRGRSEALEFHSLVGSLPVNDPDAAANQIATAMRTRGLGTMPAIADADDLNTLVAAIVQVESRGVTGLVSRDPDGAGPARGGAYGVMQVLPETGRRMAEKLGVPFDANRLRTDPEYNRRLGTAYLSELLDRYNGDSFLAATAYHAGEGNVDGWLKSVGDPRSGRLTREAWLEQVHARGNPRSAEYPRKVLEALNAGRAAASWSGYAGRRSQAATDPVGAVQGDYAVRSAQKAWADSQYVGATQGENLVQANMLAQERAGVQQGQRRSLTVGTLAMFANELTEIERAGDPDAFNAKARDISRRFGRYGDRVLQDVLEVRGDTRFAAQVASAALGMAQAGLRPTQAQQQQAASAGRANAMNSAASGQGGVSRMTDAQVLAAAGLAGD